MSYKLQDLIDMEQFQSLQDRLNEIYSFPSAIIDNEGQILTATAWQDLCTKFHRQNEECEKDCIKSDRYIADHLAEANPAVTYRCPHGLIDNATPIIIDGRHLGNFFTGQFFLEPPDLAFFKQQAMRYGFDEEAYLAAVRRVPIWTREQLNSYLFFIKGLIEVIANIGLKNLRSIESAKKNEESEQRHIAIFQTAMDGCWLADQQGHLLEVNETYSRMSGYTVPELLSMSISDLEAIETPADTAAHMQQLIAAGHGRFETKHRRKDGTVYDVEISARSNASGDGTVVAFIRDITERNRAVEAQSALEAQLRESQKMEAIGTLAGGVAHDFNNLIAAILGNVALARQDAGNNPETLLSLEEIDRAADRAKNLVQQILTFSRKQVAEMTNQPLRPIVEEALRLMRFTLPAGVQISIRLPDTPVHVKCNANQIEQVLMNLCTNAWQAMKSYVGRIEIGLEQVSLDATTAQQLGKFTPGHYARLWISDNGCGMDAETQSHVFEPFYTTKEVGKGTGLGMSVVHGIVTAHQGVIKVDSAPGRGTTMTVYLPLTAASLDAAPVSSRPNAVRGQGRRVMYVDDDQSLVLLVKRMLNRQGFITSGYDSAQQAIDAVRANPHDFDLVVTDLNMPGRSGLDVAEEVRRVHPDLPVVITSGYVTEDLRAAALDAGVRHVIYKPDTVVELCDTIDKLLTKDIGG